MCSNIRNNYQRHINGKRQTNVVKNPLANAEDSGSILGSGRFPEEGNGNPLPYSCLENPTDRGAWQGITKNWTQLSD